MQDDPLVGRTLGPYRIDRKIGEGGMGAVYRAVHVTLDQERAFKVLPERLLRDNPEYGKRFQREARSAAGLDHPNVVRVYDAGEIEGFHFIAQEFVRGASVSDIVRDRGPLPHADAVEIVLQAARGLAAAEEVGVIHRDIKPSNLMITAKGQVKVADFGLAKNLSSGTQLTVSGQVMGTPAYMSPEQADGMPTDSRTDIYSLGVTLFELVTGMRPFNAPTPLGVLRQHCDSPVPDPAEFALGLDQRLSNVIRKMMAKSAKDRFANHAELVQELEKIRRSLGEPGLSAEAAAGAGSQGSLIALVESSVAHQEEKFPKTASDAATAAPVRGARETGQAPAEQAPGPAAPSPARVPPTPLATPVPPAHKRSIAPLIAVGISAGVFAIGLTALLFALNVFGPARGNRFEGPRPEGPENQGRRDHAREDTGKLLAEALTAEQAGDLGRAIDLLERAGKLTAISGLEARLEDLKKRKALRDVRSTPKSTIKEANSALANRDIESFKNLCTANYWSSKRDSGQDYFEEAAGEGFLFFPTLEDVAGDRAALACDLIIGGKKVDFVWVLLVLDKSAGWLIDNITEEREDRDNFIGRKSYPYKDRDRLPPDEPDGPGTPEVPEPYDEPEGPSPPVEPGPADEPGENQPPPKKGVSRWTWPEGGRGRPDSLVRLINSAIAASDQGAFIAACHEDFLYGVGSGQKGGRTSGYARALFADAAMKKIAFKVTRTTEDGDRAWMRCEVFKTVESQPWDGLSVCAIRHDTGGWLLASFAGAESAEAFLKQDGPWQSIEKLREKVNEAFKNFDPGAVLAHATDDFLEGTSRDKFDREVTEGKIEGLYLNFTRFFPHFAGTKAYVIFGVTMKNSKGGGKAREDETEFECVRDPERGWILSGRVRGREDAVKRFFAGRGREPVEDEYPAPVQLLSLFEEIAASAATGGGAKFGAGLQAFASARTAESLKGRLAFATAEGMRLEADRAALRMKVSFLEGKEEDWIQLFTRQGTGWKPHFKVDSREEAELFLDGPKPGSPEDFLTRLNGAVASAKGSSLGEAVLPVALSGGPEWSDLAAYMGKSRLRFRHAVSFLRGERAVEVAWVETPANQPSMFAFFLERPKDRWMAGEFHEGMDETKIGEYLRG